MALEEAEEGDCWTLWRDGQKKFRVGELPTKVTEMKKRTIIKMGQDSLSKKAIEAVVSHVTVRSVPLDEKAARPLMMISCI